MQLKEHLKVSASSARLLEHRTKEKRSSTLVKVPC